MMTIRLNEINDFYKYLKYVNEFINLNLKDMYHPEEKWKFIEK